MGNSSSKDEKDRDNSTSSIHYGQQKFKVSQELTLQKCLELCTVLNFRPADCDRVERSPKPGVTLLQILEERSLYGEGNCEILRKALETIGMNRVAVILQPCGKTFDPQELTDKRKMLADCLKLRYKDIYKLRQSVGPSETSFIDLRLALLDPKKGRREDDQWITLNSYLDIFTNSSLKQEMRIVIEGEPGFGKTTLAFQLAYSWATATKKSPLFDIGILVFLQMGQMKRTPSIYEAIKLQLPIDCPLTLEDIEGVIQQIPSLVLTLDGWDEYFVEGPSDKNSHFVHIANNMMLTHAKVIITTRPCCPEVRKTPAVRLRLKELIHEQRQKYITEMYPHLGEEPKETMAFIEDNDFLLSLCGIPILFKLLLHGLVEDVHQNKDLNLNRVTVLFQHVVACFTSHLKSKDSGASSGFSTPDHKLCEIACSGLLSEPPQTKWGTELFHDFSCLEFWTRTGILIKEDGVADSCGLSRLPVGATSSSSSPSTPSYIRFFHGMIQEWFASQHLSRLVTKDLEMFKNSLLKLNPVHLVSLYPFICGLEPSATYPILEFLLTLKDEFPYPVMDCMFQCFYEHDGDRTPLLDMVRKICQKPVSIYNRNSRILQSAKVALLTTASQHKIPISKLNLVGVATGISDEGVMFKSGLHLPPLLTVESYAITGYRRRKTPSCEEMLQYVAKSQLLQRTWLYYNSWHVPSVHYTVRTLNFHEDSKVFLFNGKKWYILDLVERKWTKQDKGKAKRDMLGETYLLDNYVLE
ncbi:NLR family CARD domain-containing protein 4-like isoform X2 [Apostichopus japonicus]|uniref:NLR family CARD domain-containing protein 4-like isoform X2 n=1 Tax=Stichopus japonicus TaxID=307972 RepID=UPI003AB384CD